MDGGLSKTFGTVTPKLSRSQIRKMKKNMQKVPHIKQKSNTYHKLDSQKADESLAQKLENI